MRPQLLPVLLAVLLAGLLAGTIPAQTVTKVELETAGNFGTFAQQGTARVLDFLAGGKPVPQSFNASAFIAPVGGLDTFVGWSLSAGVATFNISEQGAVSVSAQQPAFTGGSTKSDPNAAVIVPGPHDLLMKITGTPGTRGILEIWASGVLDPGVKVAYSVDVGNDQTIDFRSAIPRFETSMSTVGIPRSGTLELMVRSEMFVQQLPGGGLRFKSGLSVVFTPAPHCAGQVIGDSCGPLLNRMIRSSGVLELSVSGASPLSPGVLLAGTRDLAVPLPGTTCPLRTDPLVVVPFTSDNQGGSRWTFPLPGFEVDVRLQAADLAGGAITPTNGVRILCIR